MEKLSRTSSNDVGMGKKKSGKHNIGIETKNKRVTQREQPKYIYRVWATNWRPLFALGSYRQMTMISKSANGAAKKVISELHRSRARLPMPFYLTSLAINAAGRKVTRFYHYNGAFRKETDKREITRGGQKPWIVAGRPFITPPKYQKNIYKRAAHKRILPNGKVIYIKPVQIGTAALARFSVPFTNQQQVALAVNEKLFKLNEKHKKSRLGGASTTYTWQWPPDVVQNHYYLPSQADQYGLPSFDFEI